MRILLLNPPGRVLYIRDQFCSHVSKGRYYWQPLDLLMLSGRLHAAGHELAVVDAIASRVPAGVALERVVAFQPDAVVFLTGHDSFRADAAFVRDVKARTACVTVGIGDILRDQGVRLLPLNPAIDACLNDFVTHGLERFLEGLPDDAWNMTVRRGGKVIEVHAPPQPAAFTAPVPRYEIFPLDRYRLPFNRHHPYATIVTSTGCPFPCRFCPFARAPYRWREVDDVMANFEAVAQAGIRQVHLADWTFAVNRKQADAILHSLVDANLGICWSCLSRVDLVDRERLGLFRRAGCHLVEFGVESGSQEILDRYQKRMTLAQVRAAFAWCREEGLSTLATFILGLPGETATSLQQTLDFALELEPTYCSFNIASPRLGTLLRRDMIDAGLLPDDVSAERHLDSSRAPATFSTPELDAADLEGFRQLAIRRFYWRPSYVLGRLSRLRSWSEIHQLAANGASIALQTLRRRSGGPRSDR